MICYCNDIKVFPAVVIFCFFAFSF